MKFCQPALALNLFLWLEIVLAHAKWLFIWTSMHFKSRIWYFEKVCKKLKSWLYNMPSQFGKERKCLSFLPFLKISLYISNTFIKLLNSSTPPLVFRSIKSASQKNMGTMRWHQLQCLVWNVLGLLEVTVLGQGNYHISQSNLISTGSGKIKWVAIWQIKNQLSQSKPTLNFIAI